MSPNDMSSVTPYDDKTPCDMKMRVVQYISPDLPSLLAESRRTVDAVSFNAIDLSKAASGANGMALKVDSE